MYPREFDYVAPASLDEAAEALAGNPGAKVLSGGMSLLPLMKLRLFSPELLVDIGRIPGLDQIEDHGDRLTIGAGVRHRDTASSPLVAEHVRALADAAAWTGDVQVRNRGTTCGSVAHVDVSADQPVAVLVHEATMTAHSVRGRREIPASEFFVDTMTAALEPDEILVEISLAKGNGGEGSAYDKLGRRGGRTDYAVAGAAAWVRLSDSEIVDARVGLTGVSTKPVLAAATSAAVVGTDGSPPAVEAAAELAAEDITIIEDLLVAGLVGIVLGAGSSQRLGRPKQSLPLAGNTLLGWAVINAEASSLDRIVVVVSQAAPDDVSLPQEPERAAVVYNDHYAEGCARSISAGLDSAGEADGILLLLGDVPNLKPKTIDDFAQAWSAKPAWAAIASYGGELGHPLAFSAEAFPDLRGLHGDKGVWKIVDTERGLRMTTISIDDPLPRDIDTWDDYLAECSEWGYSPPTQILNEAAAFRR